jgi:ribulose-phosphate 3-epimerase
MNILSPSLLSVDFNYIAENARELDEADTKWFHLDVMDGVFVKNITFGPPVIKCIRKVTKSFFDVHLMIVEPIRYIEAFKDAGADMLTVHYEACKDLAATIREIKNAGMKAGVAINPSTPVSAIADYVQDVDMVLVMSVEPGFGGQSFIEGSLDKLREVKKLAEEKNHELYIQVDGGITFDNVRSVIEAGCNVVVAGSAVFKGDKKANVRRFTELINS